MVRKTTKYIVTASIQMQSGPISKTAAEALKRDVKRKSPNARITMRKV
jgi:hypothetical protein